MADRTFDPPGPGSWQLGADHFPRPLTRYAAEFLPDATMEGWNRGFAEYGILLKWLIRPVNRFVYRSFRMFDPSDDEAERDQLHPGAQKVSLEEYRRSVDRLAETFESKRWWSDLEQWDAEWKPNFQDRNGALQAVEPAELSDEDLVDHIADCRETLIDGIILHHRLNPAFLIPTGDYLALIKESAEEHVKDAMSLMEGASPDSAGAVDELQRLADAINANRAARHLLFSDQSPQIILDRLREQPGDVGIAMDDWLEIVGYRLVSGWLLSEPYALERPRSLVNTLRSAVEQGVAVGRDLDLEERQARIRNVLPPERRDEFDARYAEARSTYRIRDERSLLDIRTRGLLRRALLEAGNRLANRGELHNPHHALDLEHSELSDALLGQPAPTADEVAAYADYRLTNEASDAPDRLGPEPTNPDLIDGVPKRAKRGMKAFQAWVWAYRYSAGPMESEADIVRGRAASEGSVEGRARVVTGPDDFEDIQEGDILVAELTSSAFNVVLPLLGGIVTDKGGMLSHPAIVAREFGIPGVVGCEDATERIRDGEQIIVDGEAGTVRFAK